MKFLFVIFATIGALLTPLAADGAPDQPSRVKSEGNHSFLSNREVVEALTRAVSLQLPPHVRVNLSGLYLTADVLRGSTPKLFTNGSPLGIVRFEFVKENARTSGNVTVEAFAKVAVAQVAIRHGEEISAHKFTFELRELTPLVERGYFLQGTPFDQLRANGYIRPGTVLGAANTQSPLAVERSQTVELTHQRGNLIISASVTALESGRINDWIRVRNNQTNRIFEAKVSGVGTVTTR